MSETGKVDQEFDVCNTKKIFVSDLNNGNGFWKVSGDSRIPEKFYTDGVEGRCTTRCYSRTERGKFSTSD